MFETLSQGFSSALEKLTRQGVLREDEISTALREVRGALLEADVSLDITKKFIKSVGEISLGHFVNKSFTAWEKVIKIFLTKKRFFSTPPTSFKGINIKTLFSIT